MIMTVIIPVKDLPRYVDRYDAMAQYLHPSNLSIFLEPPIPSAFLSPLVSIFSVTVLIQISLSLYLVSTLFLCSLSDERKIFVFPLAS